MKRRPILRRPFAAPISSTLRCRSARHRSAAEPSRRQRSRTRWSPTRAARKPRSAGGERAFPKRCADFSAAIPWRARSTPASSTRTPNLFRGAPYALIGARGEDCGRASKELRGNSSRDRRASPSGATPKRTIGQSESSRICRSLCPWRWRAWCRMKPTRRACRSRSCGPGSSGHAAARRKSLRSLARYSADEHGTTSRARSIGWRKPSTICGRISRAKNFNRNSRPRTNFTSSCASPPD